MNNFFDLYYEGADDTEPFVNSETSSVLFPISGAPNDSIMQSPTDSTHQKAKMAEVLMSLPPLGLKLHKPTSFMNLIETKLFPEESLNFSNEANLKKASNADIFHLRIGSWQRVAQNKEGLVAKCYFAKRKLMWEILENGLKKKIQMQWEHILAIRAEIEEDRPGILEIELSEPPLFFRETEPQPRKHTLWENASDFTGGQAMICRRHYLQFPPGALNKLYEKLLICEPRFSQMSQMPFPSLRSPYFDSNLYNFVGYNMSFGCSTNIEPYSNNFNQEFTPIRCDQSLVPSSDFSPTSVMDLSQPIEEPFCVEDVSISRMGHWGQQVDQYDEIEEQRDSFNLISSDLNPSNPNSVAVMESQSHFYNYPGMGQAEMNDNNYRCDERESMSSGNTDCRYYPQYVNWAETEESLGYANYCGQDQTMTTQNSMCPWL